MTPEPSGERTTVLLAISLLAAALWGAASQIYQSGATEFAKVEPVTVAITCTVLTIGATAGLLAVWALARTVGAERACGHLLLWFVTYAAVSSVSFPVSASGGMAPVAQYKISYLNLFIAVTAAALFTWLIRFRKSRIAAWAGFAVAFGTLAQAALALSSSNDANAGASYRLSGRGDILVFSFDALQRDIFLEALKQESELTGRLNNFLFEDNLLASSPATLASLAGELIGNQDFKSVAQTQDDLKALTEKKGITVKLAAAGYQVGTYGVYNMLSPQQPDLGKRLSKGMLDVDLVYLFQNALCRSFGGALVGSSPMSRLLGGIARAVLVFAPSPQGMVARSLTSFVGPDWDRSLARTWDDLDPYLNRLRRGGEVRAAHFMHFTFTHHPVDFDEGCNFKSTTKQWHEAAQTRSGLIEEAVCAIRCIDRVLERLQQLDAFDGNLVIIKSDHGAPVSWNIGGGMEARRIRGHQYWGYGRYSPILLIKPPGRRSAHMEFDRRPAILDDLALTICRWAKLKGACDDYQGVDLLDTSAPIPSGYWVNVVRSKASTHVFDTHETIFVKRTNSPLHAIEEALAARDGS